jgi:hypothetical protein
MRIGAATSAWLAYDISSTTETSRQALAVLQYGLLACASFALAGSVLMYATGK